MSVYSGNSGIFNVLIWILISYVQCLLTDANYLGRNEFELFPALVSWFLLAELSVAGRTLHCAIPNLHWREPLFCQVVMHACICAHHCNTY